MIDFMDVEDMTNDELDKERRWIDGVRSDGVVDVVLMYRFEEIMDEIESRGDRDEKD